MHVILARGHANLFCILKFYQKEALGSLFESCWDSPLQNDHLVYQQILREYIHISFKNKKYRYYIFESDFDIVKELGKNSPCRFVLLQKDFYIKG